MHSTERPRNVVDAFDGLASEVAREGLARQATSRPWWFMIPSVAERCAAWIMLPVTILVRAAEIVLAVVVLGIAGMAWMWWTGGITDADVAKALLPVGQRILGMVSTVAP